MKRALILGLSALFITTAFMVPAQQASARSFEHFLDSAINAAVGPSYYGYNPYYYGNPYYGYRDYDDYAPYGYYRHHRDVGVYVNPYSYGWY